MTARAFFDIAHVRVAVTDHPENGVTFALRPALGPETVPDLFSGHIEPGMAVALRALADHLEPLEAKIGAAA
jgi:hypothetical protein